MGSMTSFQSILVHCTDYISYIGSFSGAWADVNAISEALNTTYADYPINYWYNGDGTIDFAHDEHLAAYKQMLELCPDKFVEGENAVFVDKYDKGHFYVAWIIDLYNCLQVFLRSN